MTVGGHTIKELQGKITVEEYRVWLAYRMKYGPMNPVRRYDAPAALIASFILNVHGNKAKPSDFMPYGKPTIEADGDMPLQDFIKAIGANNAR